mmetsp:Transcript_7251/g.16417  ORF Transcript_7251/g.16417 Transcript_7251/m.16417 type:complete len:233 (+) Transcript_7251:38-736(+)
MGQQRSRKSPQEPQQPPKKAPMAFHTPLMQPMVTPQRLDTSPAHAPQQPEMRLPTFHQQPPQPLTGSPTVTQQLKDTVPSVPQALPMQPAKSPQIPPKSAPMPPQSVAKRPPTPCQKPAMRPTAMVEPARTCRGALHAAWVPSGLEAVAEAGVCGNDLAAPEPVKAPGVPQRGAPAPRWGDEAKISTASNVPTSSPRGTATRPRWRRRAAWGPAPEASWALGCGPVSAAGPW